jgi:hypothetical protein
MLKEARNSRKEIIKKEMKLTKLTPPITLLVLKTTYFLPLNIIGSISMLINIKNDYKITIA